MGKIRPVAERVEEFKKNKKPKEATLTYGEMEEMIGMFGVAVRLCDAFNIVNTAFYLGYMKGAKAKKGGARA